MKIIIIKISGKILSHCVRLELLFKTLSKLQNKFKFIIIHGGGIQADNIQKKLGIPIKKVNGRRITDQKTLSVAKMVYKGLNNIDVVSICQKSGLKSFGISGIDGGFVKVCKRDKVVLKDYSDGKTKSIDFGFVGDIVKIDLDILNLILNKKFIPVISCLAADEDFQVYNINADDFACALSIKIKASKLIYLSDINGIYINGKMVDSLDIKDINKMIKNKEITGGMIPKVLSAKKAVESGVDSVLIGGDLNKDWESMILNNLNATIIMKK